VVHGERLTDELFDVGLRERIESNEPRAAEREERLLDVAERRVAVELRLVVRAEDSDARLGRADLSRDKVQQFQ
jgi:hypothetical protein